MFTVEKNVRILKYSTYLKIYSKTYLQFASFNYHKNGIQRNVKLLSKLYN